MAANDLARQGVPKEILFGRYQAAGTITHVIVNQRNLLRFGRAMSTSMCMDVTTGAIVTLAADNSTVGFVNSSLEKFIDTAKAVTVRFPFYSGKDALVDEVVDGAVRDVTDAVRSVEERAIERDRFWATLIDDMQMGDFATEWIVPQHDG